MRALVTIAVDAMGGDHGPVMTTPASLALVKKLPNVRVVLVGDEAKIRAEIPSDATNLDRIEIIHASQTVGMDEAPAFALRTKKDSSIRLAVQLVKDRRADACVSAGNTGALMAISRFVLKTCEGIDRPAIMSALPTPLGCTYMLDLGANVDCHSSQLHQFALMGHVLFKELQGVASPRVALLNVGEEEAKGNDQVKQANELLQSDETLNYLGYVEGTDILSGKIDVIVCDGFVGNVALKSIEGVAGFFSKQLTLAFKQTWFTRMIGLLSLPVLTSVKRKFDPSGYNGASLVGLKGVVVKSHGNAKVKEFIRAMELAISEAEKDIPALIEKAL